MNNTIRQYLASIGARGGQSTSPVKRAAVRRNLASVDPGKRLAALRKAMALRRGKTRPKNKSK